jgi:hypothetical protein
MCIQWNTTNTICAIEGANMSYLRKRKCVFHPTMLCEEYTGNWAKPIWALLTWAFTLIKSSEKWITAYMSILLYKATKVFNRFSDVLCCNYSQHIVVWSSLLSRHILLLISIEHPCFTKLSKVSRECAGSFVFLDKPSMYTYRVGSPTSSPECPYINVTVLCNNWPSSDNST